ncbi:RiPP maturation radical SAM C-methyltransferase [Thermodesulfobacteriota bacterium]
MDICLVSMPYASVRWPSLGLGLLRSILERDGFSVSTVYASILFADEIGLVNYNRLLSDPPENGLPEWTFAHVVFPRRITSGTEFLNSLKGRTGRFAKDPKAAQILASARRQAPVFIEHRAEDILSREPLIVGCAWSFSQHVPSLALLKKIRERAPEVVTLMGGANCEAIMGKATHEFFPWVDYVVSGEADELIGPLCEDILVRERNIAAKALPVGVFAPVHRDVGYPMVEGTGTQGIPRARTKELRRRPTPNYDPFFRALEQCPSIGSAITPGVLVEASRGCWWSASGGCSFCGLNGCATQYRMRPADEVLNELDTLSRRHNVTRFEFTDNVLSPESHKTMIPQLIERGAPYGLFFEVRADLTRDHVAALRQAGVTWVQAGIESLHTEALKLMHKGTECWQNIQLLKWLYQYGIRCVWNLLHDFPSEDDAWFNEMAAYMPLLTHLAPPNLVSGIRFSRFSAYETGRRHYDIHLIPAEPYRLIYPLEDRQLERLVYFFDDRLRLNETRNPLLACILQRPGLEKAHREREKWRAERNSEPAPSLIMKRHGDALMIRDTRRVAVARETTLRGLARDVYPECDEAPPDDMLMDTFARKGFGRDETECVIAKLVERKLLHRVDGGFVALALRDPVIALEPLGNFPGGRIHVTAGTQRARRRGTNETLPHCTPTIGSGDATV